jgi:DNA-binding transcriptional regulator GbsR (MarR family)
MTIVVGLNPKALVGALQAQEFHFAGYHCGDPANLTLIIGRATFSVGTEKTDDPVTTVILTPAAKKFVLHWGEMGQAWGINRTMAQVHALLFVTPEALDAEEISRLLDVSRSNVSTSLRELITWGVVRRVHIIGDRRDRFEALKDVMETFRVIMAERKRREMDPTIALLEHCVVEAKSGGPSEDYTREQLEKMVEFVRMVTTWYGHIDRLSPPALERLFKNGPKLVKLFGWLNSSPSEAGRSRGRRVAPGAGSGRLSD